MATLDFTPLFRSSVGFDRIPNLLASAMARTEEGFPPYNIEKCGEDRYRIVLALAGSSRDEVEIVVEQNHLTVRGAKKDKNSATYVHRGIANRSFTRHFELADFIEVTDATMGDGLLVIDLKREVPEALKPRSIPINTGTFVQLSSGPQARPSATVEQQPGDRIAA
jgi:molecular chaperone IbpA